MTRQEFTALQIGTKVRWRYADDTLSEVRGTVRTCDDATCERCKHIQWSNGEQTELSDGAALQHVEVPA